MAAEEAKKLQSLSLWENLTIFPLQGHSKLPAVKWGTWKPGQKQITPGAGFGIATGSRSGGLVVLDVDTKNGAKGLESLKALGELPRTFSVQTKSGGRHLYFKHDLPLSCSAGKIGDGLDIRAEGGYVVGPGTEGYIVIIDADVAPLPVSLACLIGSGPSTSESSTRAPRGLSADLQDLRQTLKGARGDYAGAWRKVSVGERFVRASGAATGPEMGPVDDFLTGMLMWLASRDNWCEVDGDVVEQLMLPSLSLLEEDDHANGNSSYDQGQIADKFDRAAAKVRHEKDTSSAILKAIQSTSSAVKNGAIEPQVLQFRNAYFLKDEKKGYKGPYIERELWAQARDAAVFEVEVPTQHGMRPLKPLELMQLYGVGGSLDSVVNSLYIQKAKVQGKTLIMPAAPLEDIEPEYNADIEKWLMMLGGERLLDWVAVITDLERACPALWFTGEPGIGKSLFVRGACQLWGQDKATPIRSAFGRFNYRLAEMPLVEAAESIPRDSSGNPQIEQLKELITATSHETEPKHLPSVELRGAVRVILSSNNTNMIKGPKDLTSEDANALVERFIHIRHTGEEAAATKAYLQMFDIDREWIGEKKLVKYFAYLIYTRDPARGKRLRLPPHPNGLEHMLRTQPGGGFYVCRAIYDWVITAARAVKSGGDPNTPGIAWRNGTVRCNAHAIKERLQADRGSMHDRTLGDAIRRLSTGKKMSTRMPDGTTPKLWEIEFSNIIAWSDTEGWGSVEELKEAADIVTEHFKDES